MKQKRIKPIKYGTYRYYKGLIEKKAFNLFVGSEGYSERFKKFVRINNLVVDYENWRNYKKLTVAEVYNNI